MARARPVTKLLVAGVLLAFASACSMLAGVNFGDVHPQEETPGSDGGGPNGDVWAGDGPGPGTGDDSGPPGLADGAIEASSCTPDPNAVVCKGRCGDVVDNCGGARKCSTDCGLGQACVSGACQCTPQADWCKNRCGPSQNNCNQTVDCGGCGADSGLTCSAQGACGCVPQPDTTTCAGKECGTAVNNCGQTVACGNSGACATPGAICQPGGICCSDNGQACNGRCGGVSVTNNCGQSVGCAQQCTAGLVCVGTSCCTPEALATTCAGKACGPAVNNCGQAVTCPNTCAAPNTCGGGGSGVNGCGCTSTGNPCGSMCGGIQVQDNCGTSYTCSTSCGLSGACPCAGGSCTTGHYCSCKPPPCL